MIQASRKNLSNSDVVIKNQKHYTQQNKPTLTTQNTTCGSLFNISVLLVQPVRICILSHREKRISARGRWT